MKNVVFWDIKTHFVLHKKYYVSTTESSKLMLCKFWGFHGGDYEECRLLGYKKSVRTAQETYYVSVSEPSRLMLRKILGFYGGDYEECPLLGYKIPDRTSQETHYISTTESSLLMLCKIWGFHSSDYEECPLLGYKIPDRTSQETHYISTTESSLLMLFNIWGFRGSDYEDREVCGSERHYRGGKDFIIGFAGSQALPVCPSGRCKHSPVLWMFNFKALGGWMLACKLNVNGNQSLTGCVMATMLKLPSGGLHVKHTEHSNVEFGYQLSICSGTKENHGKP
jgi:hypothetical protein